MDMNIVMAGPPLISLLAGIAILIWPHRGLLPDPVRAGWASPADVVSKILSY